MVIILIKAEPIKREYDAQTNYGKNIEQYIQFDVVFSNKNLVVMILI